MGQVMGPYDAATWLTLGMLKRDIDFLRSKRNPKHELAIRQQTETYETMKRAA